MKISIILLTLLALIVMMLILHRRKRREAKKNNDLYSKKQHEYFRGEVRKNEADWIRWYDDILERKN